jgi:hypothetical protein
VLPSDKKRVNTTTWIGHPWAVKTVLCPILSFDIALIAYIIYSKHAVLSHNNEADIATLHPK